MDDKQKDNNTIEPADIQTSFQFRLPDIDRDVYGETISYRDNGNLRAPGKKLLLSKQHIEEYISCAKDLKYFAENYYHIITENGFQLIRLYDYQQKTIETIKDNRFTIIKFPRQSGKCVAADSHIKIRNKHTGEIKNIAIGQLYNKLSSQTSNDQI